MSVSENDIDLFDRYISGELSSGDLLLFNQKLNEDSDFSARFNNYRLALKAIKNKSFMDDLTQVMNDESFNKKPRRKFPISLAVAASISIVIIGTFFFFDQKNSDITFEDLYKPYPNIISERSSGNSTLNKGLKKYETGRYIEVINEFSKIDSPSDTIFFYLALSQYSLGKIDEGLKNLHNVNTKNSVFEPQVKWYLAIGYLYKNELEKFKMHLRSIKKGSFKYKESQGLLKKLK